MKTYHIIYFEVTTLKRLFHREQKNNNSIEEVRRWANQTLPTVKFNNKFLNRSKHFVGVQAL